MPGAPASRLRGTRTGQAGTYGAISGDLRGPRRSRQQHGFKPDGAANMRATCRVRLPGARRAANLRTVMGAVVCWLAGGMALQYRYHHGCTTIIPDPASRPGSNEIGTATAADRTAQTTPAVTHRSSVRHAYEAVELTVDCRSYRRFTFTMESRRVTAASAAPGDCGICPPGSCDPLADRDRPACPCPPAS